MRELVRLMRFANSPMFISKFPRNPLDLKLNLNVTLLQSLLETTHVPVFPFGAAQRRRHTEPHANAAMEENITDDDPAPSAGLIGLYRAGPRVKGA